MSAAVADAPAWAPACMDDAEWSAWSGFNSRLSALMDRADRPCADCSLGYASEMRAAGRCNGEPAGWNPDTDNETPAETPKETPVTEAPALPLLPPSDGTLSTTLTRASIAREAVERAGGDRTAAARALGTTTQGLAAILRHAGARNPSSAPEHPDPVRKRAVVDVVQAPREPLAVRKAAEAPLAVASVLGRAAVAAKTLCDVLELEAPSDEGVAELFRRERNLRRDVAVAFTDASLEAGR